MQLQPNIVFDNHYTLIRQLGRGGFSEVWLAHDSYMDLDVALKIYAPGQGMDEHSIDELRREIKVVFTLNHPNLLTPKYLGVWNGMPYLVLAYCSRGSLTQQIGKLPEQELWHVLHDVAAGLAYLHKNDIVHQDIKPDNILIDDSGNYVITDFGISAKARSTLRKSVIGGAVSGGTMAYMGPERFSKQPAPTKASDIWSLGAMAYEMITGNVPFGEMGGGMQKGGAEIPEINVQISKELCQTIESMLALNTWDRPTAETLVEKATIHPLDGMIRTSAEDANANKTNERNATTVRMGSDMPHSVQSTSQPQKVEHPKKRGFLWLAIILLVLLIGLFIWQPLENKSATQDDEFPIDTLAESANTPTITSEHQASAVASQTGETYRVQLFVKEKYIYINDEIFGGLKDIDCYEEDGLFVYMYGNTSSYNEAVKLRNQVKTLFPESFIVTFVNGKRKQNIQQTGMASTEKKEDPQPLAIHNRYTYVDLGLPSGLKWAICNVGAKNPWENGDYFAWGEIKPKTLSNYTWSNYLDGNISNSSDCGTNKDLLNGIMDIKGTRYDAARANMGGSWRMPTIEEQEELTNNCYWEWTNNYNSTNSDGYIVYKTKDDRDKGKVKVKNSQSSVATIATYSLSDTHIFLPAAGCFDSGGNYINERAVYMSSSLSPFAPSEIDVLFFYFKGVKFLHYPRYCRCSVRGVLK